MIAPKPALTKGSVPSGVSAAAPPPVGAVAPTPAKVQPRPPALTQPPPLPVEDDWESEPTRVEVIRDDAAAAVAVAPKLPAALAAPIAPLVPPASRVLEGPLARGDVQAMIRAAVEEAMAPLRPLFDLERRLAELERRASAASLAARPSQVVRAAAPATYGPGVGARSIDVPIHVESSVAGATELGLFDGRRRRRRLAIGLALALIVLFGGLFLLLAASYANTHT